MASDKPSTPFEWLAGGLFFGKNKDGIESIDECKDVDSLLKGLSENLTDSLATSPQTSETPDTAPRSTEEAEPTPSQFLAARLSRLRFLLYDERRVTSQDASKRHRPSVATSSLRGFVGEYAELMPTLLHNLHLLPFESRKHAAAIFNYMLISGLEGEDAGLYQANMVAFVEYIEVRFDDIMTTIISGHEVANHGASDVVLHFGTILRCCLRHYVLYRHLVGTTESAKRFVFPFLDNFVQVPNFDISSDAMETLRLIFISPANSSTPEREQLVADFLTRDYVALFDERFNPNLLSNTANYMTRRVALQILSTVLLTRSNYAVMINYVASRNNLVLVMKLLRDKSPHITWDAFHVFKVFVANPNKPPEVVKILKDNQVKLGRYLTTLHQDKEANDTQFRDEKSLIIATIEAL